MGSAGEEGKGREELAALRKEVEVEIASEEAMLTKLRTPRQGEGLGHLVAIALTSAMIVVIFLENFVFLLWLIVGLLLYSYNFVIILLPTTTERIRPEEKDIIEDIDRERKWLAVKLLLKRKRLAIEIGLTIFLGGMVPLAMSFTLIFGVALFFAAYLGFLAHLMEGSVALTILMQVTFILLFYALVLMLEPQSQGITKIILSYKDKIGLARTKGKMAFIILMMTIVGLVTLSAILVVGAMLLPGFTLGTLFSELHVPERIDVLALLVSVVVCQLVIMRHFQGVASRKMAINILTARLDKLKGGILAEIDILTGVSTENISKDVSTLRKEFYSIMIYDVIEHDIFGYSPIYLIGPRLRYVLDDQVISKLS